MYFIRCYIVCSNSSMEYISSPQPAPYTAAISTRLTICINVYIQCIATCVVCTNLYMNHDYPNTVKRYKPIFRFTFA